MIAKRFHRQAGTEWRGTYRFSRIKYRINREGSAWEVTQVTLPTWSGYHLQEGKENVGWESFLEGPAAKGALGPS